MATAERDAGRRARRRGGAIGLVLGVLAAGPALAAGFVSAGMGHGDYLLVKVLFPHAYVLAPAYEGPDWPVLLLVCAQYPVYGVVGGVCWKCGPRGKLIPLALAAIHLATAAYALLWGPKL